MALQVRWPSLGPGHSHGFIFCCICLMHSAKQPQAVGLPWLSPRVLSDSELQKAGLPPLCCSCCLRVTSFTALLESPDICEASWCFSHGNIATLLLTRCTHVVPAGRRPRRAARRAGSREAASHEIESKAAPDWGALNTGNNTAASLDAWPDSTRRYVYRTESWGACPQNIVLGFLQLPSTSHCMETELRCACHMCLSMRAGGSMKPCLHTCHAFSLRCTCRSAQSLLQPC